MDLVSVFDRLWPKFCSDVGLDEALQVQLDAWAPLLTVEAIEALAMHALEKFSSDIGARGTSLAALMLSKLIAQLDAGAIVVDALARLQAPEVLEDLSLDCPKAPEFLAELAASLRLAKDSPRRLRVLVVRNGFDVSCSEARALRAACDVRIPGSPYIAETGNEDAGGQGEKEMIAILRQHLQIHEVDVLLARSRGCRILAQHIVDGDSPCWSGPVLALSPAGEWGAELALAPRKGAVLITASGNDLVELSGAHPVLQRSDIDDMTAAAAARPAEREFVFEEGRRGGWADTVVALVQRVDAMR